MSALIHEPTFKTAVGDAVFAKARLTTQLGNQALHSAKPIQPADAVVAVRELFHVARRWLDSSGRTRGFTDVTPRDPEGLFSEAELDDLVDLFDRVTTAARAARVHRRWNSTRIHSPHALSLAALPPRLTMHSRTGAHLPSVASSHAPSARPFRQCSSTKVCHQQPTSERCQQRSQQLQQQSQQL